MAGTSHLSVLPLATGMMARSDVLCCLHSSSLSHQLCDAWVLAMSGSRHHQARSVFVIACMTCRISKMGMSIVVCASVCQCVSVCVSQTGGEMQIQMRGSASGPTISDLGRVALPPYSQNSIEGCTTWLDSLDRSTSTPLRCMRCAPPSAKAGSGNREGLYLQLSFRVGTGSNRLPVALRYDSSLSLSLISRLTVLSTTGRLLTRADLYRPEHIHKRRERERERAHTRVNLNALFQLRAGIVYCRAPWVHLTRLPSYSRARTYCTGSCAGFGLWTDSTAIPPRFSQFRPAMRNY